jgi:hypothetical protein
VHKSALEGKDNGKNKKIRASITPFTLTRCFGSLRPYQKNATMFRLDSLKT